MPPLDLGLRLRAGCQACAQDERCHFVDLHETPSLYWNRKVIPL
jgi:hypothetical protein